MDASSAYGIPATEKKKHEVEKSSKHPECYWLLVVPREIVYNYGSIWHLEKDIQYNLYIAYLTNVVHKMLCFLSSIRGCCPLQPRLQPERPECHNTLKTKVTISGEKIDGYH